MPDIILVRQPHIAIPEDKAAAAREVVFGIVDGLGDKGRKQWRTFWNRTMALEPGEMQEISTVQHRLGWYHRKHMALEQAVFEGQERFDDFEQFRIWLKVGAGHVIWTPGPKGGVFPVPKSIKYANMEQGEFEEFHRAVVNFLRTQHAAKTLWPHLGPRMQIEMVESIMGDFRE